MMGDQKRVNVYLWVFENAPGNPLFGPDNPLGLFPVSRQVSRTAPARPALEQLIAGPTQEERSHGIEDLGVGHFKINTFEVSNGTATVDFRAEPGPNWPGDLSPARFRAAVEGTLRQFPTVQRVRVGVNGDDDFDSSK